MNVHGLFNGIADDILIIGDVQLHDRGAGFVEFIEGLDPTSCGDDMIPATQDLLSKDSTKSGGAASDKPNKRCHIEDVCWKRGEMLMMDMGIGFADGRYLYHPRSLFSGTSKVQYVSHPVSRPINE